MSFDLFFITLPVLQNITFSRSILDEVLGPYIVAHYPEGSGFQVRFPDGGLGEIYVGAAETEIEDFCINRPGGDDLFDAIFNILRRTPMMMYWGDGAVVARPELIDLVPKDLDGPVTVVTSGADIIRCIEES